MAAFWRSKPAVTPGSGGKPGRAGQRVVQTGPASVPFLPQRGFQRQARLPQAPLASLDAVADLPFTTAGDLIRAGILSGHRRVAPYGLEGGGPGLLGKNSVIRRDGRVEILNGTDGAEMAPGDVFLVETPGGGGYGRG